MLIEPEHNIRPPIRRERGAVFVLALIFLTVIAFFLAFGVDWTMRQSVSEQSRNHADLAALGALEAYYKELQSNPSATMTERLDAALARAQEFLNANTVVGKTGSAPNTLVGAWNSDNPPESPVLEAGNYWFQAPTNVVPAPCETYPCFKAASDPTTQSINSFRIRGEVFPPMSALFARLYGQSSFPVTTQSTATVVPRHGCFVVDLSPSMAGLTHTIATGLYSYFLSSDNPGVPLPADWVNDDLYWNGDTNTPANPRKGDYQLVSVLANPVSADTCPVESHHPTGADYSVPNVWQFRVDTKVKPEPLTSVLDGIRTAMITFKNRAVAGDKACLIFFDELSEWTHIISLNSDFDAMSDFLDPSKNSLNLHGLFPRSSSRSDLHLALTEALSQLASASSEGLPASNFVVLFSDGMANCFPTATAGVRDCGNDLDHYIAAQAKLKELATTYNTRRIPVNIVLTGDHAHPHTMDFLDPSDNLTCLTDARARELGIDFVLGGDSKGSTNYSDLFVAWQNMYRQVNGVYTDPFYQSNADMYYLAVRTGGFWLPLLPDPSPTCVIGSCNNLATPPRHEKEDFRCRTQAVQITEGVTTVMGDHPFTIVE